MPGNPTHTEMYCVLEHDPEAGTTRQPPRFEDTDTCFNIYLVLVAMTTAILLLSSGLWTLDILKGGLLVFMMAAIAFFAMAAIAFIMIARVINVRLTVDIVD
ncbi:hypothetical protein PG984_014199 [Apiospora sp. TS-2023a]